jgi:hypothetical protein
MLAVDKQKDSKSLCNSFSTFWLASTKLLAFTMTLSVSILPLAFMMAKKHNLIASPLYLTVL